MTKHELEDVAADLGLSSKEVAHLLGVSPKTITRGIKDGAPADLFLREIVKALEDPRISQSARALVVMCARSDGGFRSLVSRLIDAYVTMDRFHLR